MYLPNILTTLLLGLGSLTMTTSALKCACEGGTDHSRIACDRIGAEYGLHGCGFTGCCVFPGDQQRRFIDTCRHMGFEFKRCDDCPAC